MATQWAGWRPDNTPQYASALAALMGEQTRRGALGESSALARKKTKPDLWKQSFMEKDLAQQKEISEMQERGRQARFDPKIRKPLTPQEQALQALASGGTLPGIGNIGTRKLARTLPDLFQLMVPQMEETMRKQKEGEVGRGRVESGDPNQAIFKQLVDMLVKSQPIGGIPSRYEKVAD